MNPVLVLQHAAPEGPGSIGAALVRKGLGLRTIRIDQGAPVPETLEDCAGLVVMGGPMSVYESDRIPHLAAELRLLEQAVRAGTPVLGICLGSQLLAGALGARVYASGRKEIGWHEVRLAPAAGSDALWRGLPDRFMAFHWHGDVFDLPRGAAALASSSMTPLQGFRYGPSAYGLLFHLEVGASEVSIMVETFSDELRAAGLAAGPILEGFRDHAGPVSRTGGWVFERWADLVQTGHGGARSG